ncbi:hypothetical protein QE445_002191 [Pantoea ananatis]|nr:hypothetical protein [Pantoea ananatis]
MVLRNYQPIPVIRRYYMETSRSFILKQVSSSVSHSNSVSELE